MADGVGEESIAVSPTSLRAAASGFDEKAKEITRVRQEMLGRREMVTLNGYDIDLNITAFQNPVRNSDGRAKQRRVEGSQL